MFFSCSSFFLNVVVLVGVVVLVVLVDEMNDETRLMRDIESERDRERVVVNIFIHRTRARHSVVGRGLLHFHKIK